MSADGGPTVRCKSVRDLEVVRVRALKEGANEPFIELQDVQEAVVQSCSTSADSPALMLLKGGGNANITLALNRVSKRTKEVTFADGASEQAVVRRS